MAGEDYLKRVLQVQIPLGTEFVHTTEKEYTDADGID